MRGAEAVVKKVRIIGRPAIAKIRMAKSYRIDKLDNKLRTERTRSEARLLNKAKMAGVECPTVFEVSDFEIVMSFVNGKRPAMKGWEAIEAGRILAKLHGNDIIHGDYTPANLICTNRDKRNSLIVIDFGLGYISKDIEDKAVDVFTMLRAIDKKMHQDFVKGYNDYTNASDVISRVKIVEKRVRYAVV